MYKMAQQQLFADEYKVSLDVFEGPLDLLLYLIRREELDIYDIPIEHITAEYMKFIEDGGSTSTSPASSSSWRRR